MGAGTLLFDARDPLGHLDVRRSVITRHQPLPESVTRRGTEELEQELPPPEAPHAISHASRNSFALSCAETPLPPKYLSICGRISA